MSARNGVMLTRFTRLTASIEAVKGALALPYQTGSQPLPERAAGGRTDG